MLKREECIQSAKDFDLLFRFLVLLAEGWFRMSVHADTRNLV